MSPNGKVPVLCTRHFTEAQLARLRAVSPRLVVEQRSVSSRAELGHVLGPEVEVLFSSFAPESLAGLPRLRWYQARSAGVNALMNTPLWTSDVAITTTSGLGAVPIAEMVLGLMIALARDFRGLLAGQQNRQWPKVNFERFPGYAFRGRTLLIVGYGSVGRQLARITRPLGLRIIAVKRDPTVRRDEGYRFPETGDPEGTLPERILGPAQLAEALPLADFVVIAAAATPANHHLIGETQLRLLRPDAFLINVARGDIVEETALVRALREKWIAGAGLDVFEKEPLPADSPFWQFENVILSPHIAGFTPDYDDRVVDIFTENLHRYLEGRPLLNLVDRHLGY